MNAADCPIDLSSRPPRLNWGCGPNPPADWFNADRHAYAGVDLVGPIREGLALPDACMDYAVSIHGLQDLPWPEIPGALAELRRVLRPGAPLRISVPDLDKAIDAYRRGDKAYFHVPDKDARSVGAKLITQIIWYGSVLTPFTFDFACEVLTAAGFTDIQRSSFRQTATPYPDIVVLDNRERESLFIEARRA